MLLRITPPLKFSFFTVGGWYWCFKSGQGVVCHDRLCKYFEIPTDTIKLQLTLCDNPLPDKLQLIDVLYSRMTDTHIIMLESGSRYGRRYCEEITGVANEYIRKEFEPGKPLYIGVVADGKICPLKKDV